MKRRPHLRPAPRQAATPLLQLLAAKQLLQRGAVNRVLLRGTAASLLLWFAMLAVPARAQGCAQCRDNTQSTSPATQRAFRHSIEFMGGAAAAFFAATWFAVRRFQ